MLHLAHSPFDQENISFACGYENRTSVIVVIKHLLLMTNNDNYSSHINRIKQTLALILIFKVTLVTALILTKR